MSRRAEPVSLLWLEGTPSGSAAQLHLAGTRRRLLAAGRDIGVELTDSGSASRTTLGRLRRLSRLVLRGVVSARPETLVVRHHPLAAPVVWAWKRRGARVVISVQGPLTNARSDGGPWARVLPVDGLTRWQLRTADALVTVTPGLATQLEKFSDGKVPVALIPNGIEQLAAVARISRNRPYACFAGNLASWQGVDLMLDAVRSTSWPSDVDLVIVGDGALRDRVVARAPARVDYRGPLPRAETQSFLAGALCAFSLQDPDHPAGSGGYWPFKVLESAALGVPIVVSDAPGLPEMAEKLGHAVVCPYGDPDAVADAVASLHRDPARRAMLAEAGRERVGDYAWEAGAQRLAEVL